MISCGAVTPLRQRVGRSIKSGQPPASSLHTTHILTRVSNIQGTRPSCWQVLKLSLKKGPYDVMVSGEKKKEYREATTWLTSRLVDSKTGQDKPYDRVEFRNGYSAQARAFTASYKGYKLEEAGVYVKFSHDVEWDSRGKRTYIISFGADIEMVNPLPPAGLDVRIGTRLRAKDRVGAWLGAKVLRHRGGKGNTFDVLVHFHGYAARFDEWIPVSSGKLAAAAAVE